MGFDVKTAWKPCRFALIQCFLEEPHKLDVFLLIFGGVSVVKLLEILAFVEGCQLFFILTVKVNDPASDLTLDIY